MREHAERIEEPKEFAQITIPARDLARYEATGWVLVYQEGRLAAVRKNIRTSTPAR